MFQNILEQHGAGIRKALVESELNAELLVEMYDLEVREYSKSRSRENTFHGVREMKEKLENILHTDILSEKFVEINKALNTVHNSGEMIEHVQGRFPEITKKLLTELSNIDTTEWDNELKEMGVIEQQSGYKIARRNGMIRLSTRTAISDGDMKALKNVAKAFGAQAGDPKAGLDLMVNYFKTVDADTIDPLLKYVAPFLNDANVVSELYEQVGGAEEAVPDDQKKMTLLDFQILKDSTKAVIESEIDSLDEYAIAESVSQTVRDAWTKFIENIMGDRPTMLPREYRYLGAFLKDAKVMSDLKAYIEGLGYKVGSEFGYDAAEEVGEFDNLEKTNMPHLDDLQIDDVKNLGLIELSEILGDAPREDDRINLDDGRLFVVDHVDYPNKSGVVRRIADKEDSKKNFRKGGKVKVFLGGTCSESKWRDEIKPLLDEKDIDYFDPVVDDWDEEAYQNELRERESSDKVLYVITPKMTGLYSIAEVIDDSNKRPEKTIFVVLDKDGDDEFSEGQSKSLGKVGEMVVQNGGKFLNGIKAAVSEVSKSN